MVLSDELMAMALAMAVAVAGAPTEATWDGYGYHRVSSTTIHWRELGWTGNGRDCCESVMGDACGGLSDGM
jgi:hypothetical protein